MLKRIQYLTLILLGLGHLSQSHASSEQDIVAGCQKLTQYAQQGAKFYQQKHYQKARDAFLDQAAWIHFCLYQTDITGKKISDEQLATAYNNVGLSYAKLAQPRWARAWFELTPESAKSQFNLKQLPPVQASKSKQGTYVRYAGQGQWNTLEITNKGNVYQIDFNGLRMGVNGLIYGPNLGEFSITMPKNASLAEYHHENCIIQLKFLPANAQGERIKVTQNQMDAECGFGFGVYADGSYLKVEN
ncbi:hypothetical protein [Acinetobacter populi]|uniref:Tetratricopeptide repeat protein n=1 Tax=Acinetobacter populi TaxID=1582270 RepID=A0A1Z9Z3D2_9GAMM|nr:hypothetical protein [Acinetobacter populi]OUY08932.1 hypothetical protein CAP51_04785 [Acinetobacter populi]